MPGITREHLFSGPPLPIMEVLSRLSQSLRSPPNAFPHPFQGTGGMSFNLFAHLNPSQVTDLRHNEDFRAWLTKNQQSSPFSALLLHALSQGQPQHSLPWPPLP